LIFYHSPFYPVTGGKSINEACFALEKTVRWCYLVILHQ
jgi:hypothetical protein